MSRSLPLLRHIHLPDITRFSTASTLQTNLVSSFLQHKATLSSSDPAPPSLPAPIPTLLTFTPTPVYTLGRREAGSLSAEKIKELKQPFLPKNFDTFSPKLVGKNVAQHAEVVETLRGGQITFHGPGQLVIYPILDLRNITSSKFPHGISPRSYIHLLEEVTIQTIAAYGIQGIRTENPGVWLPPGNEKIAAIGVHLRRNIASYGVGLNVSTDVRWWDRIVGCGLEGKGVTTMRKEVFRIFWEEKLGETNKRGVPTQQAVGKIWAREFMEAIWGPDVLDEYVERIGPGDIVYKELMQKPNEVELSEGKRRADKLWADSMDAGPQLWTPIETKSKSEIDIEILERKQANNPKLKSKPLTSELVKASLWENRDETKQQPKELKETMHQKLKDEEVPDNSLEMELAISGLSSTAREDLKNYLGCRRIALLGEPNPKLRRYQWSENFNAWRRVGQPEQMVKKIQGPLQHLAPSPDQTSLSPSMSHPNPIKHTKITELTPFTHGSYKSVRAKKRELRRKRRERDMIRRVRREESNFRIRPNLLDARAREAQIGKEGSEKMEERDQWELLKMRLKEEDDHPVDTRQKGKRREGRDEQMEENDTIEATKQKRNMMEERVEEMKETVQWKTPRMMAQDENRTEDEMKRPFH